MECWKCEHVRRVVGSAHSSCHHPEVKILTETPIADLFAALGVNAGQLESLERARGEFGITVDPHGLAKGWANWPFNFDPVWIQECPGFSRKPGAERGPDAGS